MMNQLTDLLGNIPYQLWKYTGSDTFKPIYQQALGILEPPFYFPLNANDIAYTDSGLPQNKDIHFQYAYDTRYVLRVPSFYEITEAKEKELIESLPFLSQKIMEQSQKNLLQKLHDSINAITALTKLDELLSQIIDTTMEVIPEADIGVLWVYDERENCLKVRKTSSEVDDSMMKHMRMKPGEGMVGTVFQQGEARMYQTSSAIFQASANMSIDNLDYLGKAYPFTNAKSVLCAPVKVRQKTKCVLILYQFQQATFDADEMDLLKNFADQVSIALHNTNIFESMQAQNKLLEKRTEIHERLVQLSLQKRGITFIQQAFEEIVGFPFSLIDAYDYPIGEKDYLPIVEGHLQKLRQNESRNIPFLVTASNKQAYEVFPIMSVNTCLGYLIFEERNLSSIQRMVLEQGIPILALEMIHQKTETENRHKASEEAFQHVLLAKTNAELQKAVKQLGLEHFQSMFVLIFDLSFEIDALFTNLYMQRFISFIQHQLKDKLTLLYTQETSIITLIHADTAKEAEKLVSTILPLPFSAMKARAGMGSNILQPNQIGKSYKEAYKALYQLQDKSIWHQLLHFKDIGINQLFLHQPEEEIYSFVHDFFQPLTAFKGNDPHLIETLQVYIQNNRSINQTAKTLHIHVNTLYQRLQKIEQHLNISFKNAEDALKAQLACYLKENWITEPD